jgi:hypothetical protein
MSIVVKGALFVIVAACIAAIMLRRTRGSSADPEITGSVTSEHGEIAALDALRKAGNDVTKPTEVTYYLDFPDADSAKRAADAVHWWGSQVEGRENGEHYSEHVAQHRARIPAALAHFPLPLRASSPSQSQCDS